MTSMFLSGCETARGTLSPVGLCDRDYSQDFRNDAADSADLLGADDPLVIMVGDYLAARAANC